MSNREKGDRFSKIVGEYLKYQGFDLQPEFIVHVGLNSRTKKPHAFDHGNNSMLIECKYYGWTKGGNNPSGKIATINEAMVYFHATPDSYSKKLFISKTSKKGIRRPETLAEYYVRLHGHFIPDNVEIWEFDSTTNEARKLF
jgi:hypothetical protein